MNREGDGASGRRPAGGHARKESDDQGTDLDKSALVDESTEVGMEPDDQEPVDGGEILDGADPKFLFTRLKAKFGRYRSLMVTGSERIVGFGLTLVALLLAGLMWIVSPVISIVLLCVISLFAAAAAVAMWRR